MNCPNCDAEMYEDDAVEGLWHCPDCGYEEHEG